MADLGTEYTDAALKDIEKQLKSVYNNAYKDILKKQKDFNAAYARKEAKYQAKLDAGQITQDQFDAWKRGQVFQGEQWQAKKRQILDTLYSSNDIATKIINGQTTNVFAFNANYQSFSLEHGAGVNFGFGLYDSSTVVNLIKNDPKLLPEWKIDQPKDYKWNQKKLNRQINLGIVEGESLDKIAKRLCDALSTQNFNHMRTFARTAMTGAQNAGRETSLQAAQDKGIKVKKEWMCTLDGHTRTNHRLLDGQRQPLDKPFEVDGMKIRYPGDPEAHPSMVYNCRCTMVGDVEDYPAEYERYDNIDGKPIKNMTYEEWAKAKTTTPTNQTKLSSNIIDGKDISGTWVRRPEQFDFAIEDVINAQGFDGLPRVVSAEEFDKVVKESNIIMQRGYRAPNKEVLNAYKQELYGGKWYVDCSVGGAGYGRGMYTAYNKGTTLLEDTAKMAESYSKLGFNTVGRIETMTMDSTFKAISYDDAVLLAKEYQNKIASNKENILNGMIDNLLGKYDLSDKEKLYYKTMFMVEERNNEDFLNAAKWYMGLNDDKKEKINEFATNYIMEDGRKIKDIMNDLMHIDEGTVAALNGYDGIYGSNGAEFVVLNRTKLIIKKEG